MSRHKKLDDPAADFLSRDDGDEEDEEDGDDDELCSLLLIFLLFLCSLFLIFLGEERPSLHLEEGGGVDGEEESAHEDDDDADDGEDAAVDRDDRFLRFAECDGYLPDIERRPRPIDGREELGYVKSLCEVVRSRWCSRASGSEDRRCSVVI